jgi:3-oxoacyl-[acyl-carrier protein] reductase
MLKADYGRIVNIASIAGKDGNPNASHYSASKAGLISLTKSLGKELASGTPADIRAHKEVVSAYLGA